MTLAASSPASALALMQQLCLDPVGVVCGDCTYDMGRSPIRSSGVTALPWVARALCDAQSSALARMCEQAEQVGAHGIVDVRLSRVTIELDHDMAERPLYNFTALGTAVTCGDPQSPFLSRTMFVAGLDIPDIWKLAQMGCIPVSVVVGAGVQRAREPVQMSLGPRPLEHCTHALRLAQDEALTRLQTGALGQDASGVIAIDFTIDRSLGRGVFAALATGTAISRPVSKMDTMEFGVALSTRDE